MTRIRPIFALLLAPAVAFILSACSDDETDPAAESESDTGEMGSDADSMSDAASGADASAQGDGSGEAGDGEGSGDEDGSAFPPPPEVPLDWRAEATDFDCLTDWTAVRGFYMTNVFGDIDRAVAAAETDFATPLPPGTIVQLIPQEAMVKLAPGANPETDDWEFFTISNSEEGSEIVERGFLDIENVAGTCFGCHAGAADRDLICEQTGQCEAAALPRDIVDRLVAGDSRCTE